MSVVKSAIQPSTIIKFAVGFLVFNLIINFLGVSDWIYYPYESFKTKFGK